MKAWPVCDLYLWLPQRSSWRSVWGHYHVEKHHTGQFVKEVEHALLQNVTVHARMEMFMFPFMNHTSPVLQHSCTDHKATSTIFDCGQSVVLVPHKAEHI